jgi:hypothetical protein
MDGEALHVLFQKVVESSDSYGKAIHLFGRDSMQAKKAFTTYNDHFATWKRERHWEEFCSAEGFWQPECRVYDC